MLIRPLFFHDAYAYAYLIADRKSRDAVLIDPVREHVSMYLKLLKELNLTLQWSIETHVHADHITAAKALKKHTGCKTGIGAGADVQYADRIFKQGDHIALGQMQIEVIETPGHTVESVCYYTKGHLFSGDTLLIRGTGRTDFQGGSAVHAYESLQKILMLPDFTVVHPGHDYKGMIESTIIEEKLHNQRLQVTNAKAYEKLMSQLNLPRPKMIDEAVLLNQQGGS